MVSAINTALTGLNAASRRLQVSANNVANLSSTLTKTPDGTIKEPYKPQQVTQSSLATGGVSTNVRTKDPASISVYAPDDAAANEEGITEFPNVNLEEEVVNQVTASYDYKANLKVIKTQNEVFQSLLDIKT